MPNRYSRSSGFVRGFLVSIEPVLKKVLQHEWTRRKHGEPQEYSLGELVFTGTYRKVKILSTYGKNLCKRLSSKKYRSKFARYKIAIYVLA